MKEHVEKERLENNIQRSRDVVEKMEALIKEVDNL